MKKLPLFAAMSVLLSGNAFAGSMGPVHYDPDGFVMALSLGPAWALKNDTQSLYIWPGLQKTYTVNDTTGAVLFGEAFVGIKRHYIPQVATILGVGVGAIGKTTTNGFVYDDGDPRLTNQSYTSSKSTTYVLAKAKLITSEPVVLNIKPFIEGGIGAGYNRVSNYTNTSIACGVPADTNFQSNKEWKFGFTVGAGLSTALTDKIDLSVAGVYADFGTTDFGSAPGQTTAQRLSNDMSFAGVLVGLTAHFDDVSSAPAGEGLVNATVIKRSPNQAAAAAEAQAEVPRKRYVR